MVGAYSQDLRDVARLADSELNMTTILREGTYLMQAGPSFGTVAFYRFIKCIGADAVGMCLYGQGNCNVQNRSNKSFMCNSLIE